MADLNISSVNEFADLNEPGETANFNLQFDAQTTATGIMKKTTILLVAILAMFASNCVKKKFEKLATPSSLILYHPDKTVDILQEPLKEDMVKWSNKNISKIPVEGFLRVTYKDNDYFYLQMNCPKELKCNGSKAYVPRNLTYDENFEKHPFKDNYKLPEQPRFILARNEKAEGLVSFRDWLLDPEKPRPTGYSQYLMGRYLEGQDDMAAKVAEFHIISTMLYKKENELDSSERSTDLLKKYGTLFDDRNNKFNKWRSDFSSHVDKVYHETVKAYLGEFPFQGKNYKELSKNFNKIKSPLLRDLILNKALEDTPYRVKGIEGVAFANADSEVVEKYKADYPEEINKLSAPAEGGEPPASAEKGGDIELKSVELKSTVKPMLGLKLSYNDGGKKEYTAEKITAKASKHGLTFNVATDEGKIVLEPLKVARFLYLITKKEIRKLVKTFPKSYKSIVDEFEYSQAAIALALMNGDGGYVARQRKFIYKIDLSKRSNFWKLLRLFKAHDSIAADSGTFAGKVEGQESEYGETTYKVRWSQRYSKDTKDGSFNVKGKIVTCERMCDEEEVDATCLSTDSMLTVQFPVDSFLHLKEGEGPRAGTEVEFIFDEDATGKENDEYYQGSICNRLFSNYAAQDYDS